MLPLLPSALLAERGVTENDVSSVMIVPPAVAVPMVAPVAPDSVTVNVSVGSAVVSHRWSVGRDPGPCR